eukprot:COSAG06_NODE_2402_length_6947_cov_4.005111_6_plen_221_part_01
MQLWVIHSCSHPCDLFVHHLFDAECEGLDGFASAWVVKVAVLPGVLLVCIFIYFMIQRLLASSREDRNEAVSQLQGHAFMAIFFLYPPICNVVFATFNCRPMGSTEVLMSDDRVRCSTPEHDRLEMASFVVMVGFCFGLPLLCAYILVSKARDYQRICAGSNSVEHLVADRVAQDFGVDVDTAQYIIRDVAMSARFSFIIDAYRPRVLYWEALDMMRKLM